jgi:hypothetical protein
MVKKSGIGVSPFMVGRWHRYRYKSGLFRGAVCDGAGLFKAARPDHSEYEVEYDRIAHTCIGMNDR